MKSKRRQKSKKIAVPREIYFLLGLLLGLTLALMYTLNAVFLYGMIIVSALVYLSALYSMPSYKGKYKASRTPAGAGPHTIWGNSLEAISSEYHLNFRKMEENEKRKKKGQPPIFP